MTTWKQTVLVILGALVGPVPAFIQLSYAQTFPEAVPVLPSGEELPNEELLEVKGESPILVVLGVGLAAAGYAVLHEAFFDEDYVWPGLGRCTRDNLPYGRSNANSYNRSWFRRRRWVVHSPVHLLTVWVG